MKHLLATVAVLLALPACTEEGTDYSDTSLQQDHLMKVMHVNIATIDLPEPRHVAVFTEFQERQGDALVGEKPKGRFLVAIQPDDETGRLRLAMGDEQQAISSTLDENPFADRGWIFHPTPAVDEQGRYTIMETDPNEPPVERIVVVTTPPRPNKSE